jgi:tRNA1Val (adenine37-N6)-methyltransferase
VKECAFDKKYDLIISNPPFYEGDLKSAHQHKNIAKHDAGLTLEELVDVIDRNLSDEGSFAVLLPYHRTDEFIANAQHENFYLTQLVRVKQSLKHNYFRSILLFSHKQNELKEEDIVIKEEGGVYSERFISLLTDYYLYL